MLLAPTSIICHCFTLEDATNCSDLLLVSSSLLEMRFQVRHIEFSRAPDWSQIVELSQFAELQNAYTLLGYRLLRFKHFELNSWLLVLKAINFCQLTCSLSIWLVVCWTSLFSIGSLASKKFAPSDSLIRQELDN